MSALISLCWRNLWRRKRRTGITAISVGLGVVLAVTFTGTGDYMYTNMINASAEMGFGHVTVQPPGYQLTPGLDKVLRNADGIRDQLAAHADVTGALVRITGPAMFASATKTVGGAFMGIDVAAENADTNLFIRALKEGAVLAADDERGALVGRRMARKLGLGMGRKFVYTATDANGQIVSQVARVRGIFETGVAEVDGGLVVLPIQALRQTLAYGEHDATLVAATITDQRQARRVRNELRTLLGPGEHDVLDWNETQVELAGLIAVDRASNYIMQLLIGLVIAAGILNTMLMSVLERTREFGVMLAIGMSPARLFRQVMAESMLLGLLGLVTGIVLTIPWFYYLREVGIDFSDAIGGDYTVSGVLVDPIIHIRLFPLSAALILLAVFALTVLAALYPAWRAGRVPPVETLRTI